MSTSPGPFETMPVEAASWWRDRRLPFAALLLWALCGVIFVPTDQQAVVTRFGAVVEPRLLPGVHYALPWPVDRVTRLKVNQQQRRVIGGESADLVLGTIRPLAAQFLTGDQNIIQMRVVVQYSVRDRKSTRLNSSHLGI